MGVVVVHGIRSWVQSGWQSSGRAVSKGQSSETLTKNPCSSSGYNAEKKLHLNLLITSETFYTMMSIWSPCCHREDQLNLQNMHFVNMAHVSEWTEDRAKLINKGHLPDPMHVLQVCAPETHADCWLIFLHANVKLIILNCNVAEEIKTEKKPWIVQKWLTKTLPPLKDEVSICSPR